MKYFFAFILLALSVSAFAQVEMVPPEHNIYSFLRRMKMEDIISGYNPSDIPISRAEIADYLKTIEKAGIAPVDRQILKDYLVEFSYDLNKNLKKSVSILNDFKIGNFFDDNKQKYIYAYSDSNKSLFVDIGGNISYRSSQGDSLRDNSITLGELGFRLRGTLYNSVGFYLRASNGQKLSGGTLDRIFSYNTDPRLKGNWRYTTQGKNFDTFEGYLRYQTDSRWLALTVGREALFQGNGYIDRLYLSNNTTPFDFIKLNLAGGIFKYSFLFGTLKGDSLGREIRYKSIATHKVDLQFSNRLKLGFWESVTISDNPFSLTFLNPISFLTSADLNTGSISSDNNNALMGFDFEVMPFKNLTLQSSLIIDDLEFGTLFSSDSLSGINKFAYQGGIMWNNAFTVPALTASLEYTYLDPLFYSHYTNKSQYTHWGMPLGHALPPNSDQIAVKLSYFPYNRLRLDLTYAHQRHAEGFKYDSLGKVLINYGGNINNGTGALKGKFLDGNRIDSDIITFYALWEPLRQYFLEVKYVYKFQDLIYLSKKVSDSWFFLTARVDW